MLSMPIHMPTRCTDTTGSDITTLIKHERAYAHKHIQNVILLHIPMMVPRILKGKTVDTPCLLPYVHACDKC
jgi:hypothetical protein